MAKTSSVFTGQTTLRRNSPSGASRLRKAYVVQPIGTKP